MRHPIFFGIILMCYINSATAQTREKGPWWPHPIWGANDQAGSSNWITPDKILKAMSLVKTGKVYELGHVYERGMPLVGNRSYNIFIPSFPTHGPVGKDSIVFNDEYVASEIGQVGTQFDGPGHVGKQMAMADGTTTQVFYNGTPADEIRSPYGLLKLGVENVKPIITRGILIDLAGYKGIDILQEGYEITLADVRNALTKEGLKESDIEPGDALLFSRPLKTHFEELKIKNLGLSCFVETEKSFKNTRQKEKRVYLPLVDHPFEVHTCGCQHNVDVISLDPFVKIAA